MKDFLLVGAGGFLGSVLRYGISLLLPLTSAGAIPWGTLTVNFTGSLLIGVLLSLEPHRFWLLLLAAGFCGGFTTFSTFSFEAVSALKAGETATAAIYVAVSLALCFSAVAAGLYLGMKFK